MDSESLHQAMLRPETYPAAEGPIEFRETHISRLYLTARDVYKVKKPFDFGFLDFTTLCRRRFYCEEEVRLNRRFAPDTYLDVAEIRRTSAGLRIGGHGETIEYAVHMRRLPQEAMLDSRLAASDPALPAEMERLGRRLAELHAQSPVCRETGGRRNLEVVRGNWRENFEQMLPFANTLLSSRAHDFLRMFVDRFLASNAALLLQREEEGFVRDGHGDLHAEHICLTEPIRIYDCIEFNRRFRIADIAADLAFILMDLDFRRRRDLASRLRHAYSAHGPKDSALDLLLPFYMVYRAFVRGKVESFLAEDRGAASSTRQEAATRARNYFNLALGYLCPPLLILIGGLMGTGKSTVAAALGAPLLRADAIRKEIAGELASSGSSAAFHTGIYAPEFSNRTYDLLLQKTREAAAGGETVIVDASFAQHRQRERFREVARQLGIPCFLAITSCDRETALHRLDQRQASGQDVSDGRRQLFDSQAAIFDPVAEEESALVIDTLQCVDYNVQSLLCEFISRAGMHR